ncbi:hypothetical protein H4219_000336 [Mycoemilia scoparia]|uniref:PWI domain-containing protein n=1 Tax=Mycoemilia scoparia TaxID=417184 RepID=A0A9W8A3B8_9FUNG|nr:hypothetical protein H4219_000336 [Mycoemilia scoparia]
MSAGFFRGTNIEQDNRFGDAQKKLLNKIKFPEEFKQKVDTSKVNLDVIKPWISLKVTEILGLEDEVVLEYVFSMLEEKTPDPRKLQINIAGFLESKAPEFSLELWKLLLSAQKSSSGIPEEFIEAKKAEIRKKQLEEEKINEAIRSRRRERRDEHRPHERSHRDRHRDHRHRHRHRSRSQERRRRDSRERRHSSRHKRNYDHADSNAHERSQSRERHSRRRTHRNRRHHHSRSRSPSSSPHGDKAESRRRARSPPSE